MIVRFASSRTFFAALAMSALVACSGSSDSSPGGAAPAGTSDPTNPNNPDPNNPGSTTGTKWGSYVILGDSISDNGGLGPFFYDLLVQNDDAKYPDEKGKDLKTADGATIKVVKNSQSGAQSKNLPKQVSGLPTSLPGPVAITVTIGGNDMQGNILAILGNNDTAERAAFAKNLKTSYDELTRPDRFGPGVKVKIFHANIYDPSDGEGNFAESGCPGILAAFPKQPTTVHFDAWNKAGSDVVTAYGEQAVVVDMHSTFLGKGVGHLKDGTSFYAPDCIHPNAKGHDAIRRMFFGVIQP